MSLALNWGGGVILLAAGVLVGRALFIPCPCEGLPVLLGCGEIVPDRQECLSYWGSSRTYHALAWFRSSIEGRSSLSSTEAIKSFNCSMLVALTIGAVMLGRANSHARDTLAGVALCFFAT